MTLKSVFLGIFYRDMFKVRIHSENIFFYFNKLNYICVMKKQPEIIQDPRNYRKHSDKNKRIIKKSLDDYGAGRSILIDSENQIIAGNGVKEQWGNKPVKIIETDGTELIVVKRNDLKPGDEKRKKLAILDNHASDTSEFDNEMIFEDFEKDFLQDFEIEISEPKQKQIQELKSFNQNHILISYPLQFHTQIIEFIKGINNIDDKIEIQSSAN